MANFADDIQRRTELNGREHARLIIADWEAQKLLAHKNIHVGDENSATLHLTKQKGRENFQSIVGVLHTHPVPAFPSFHRQHLHLSGEDFRVLLTNEEMLFMLARYDGENLIALKTTATPNYTLSRFDSVLRDLEYEFIDNSRHGSFTERAVKFTKHVCLETGLTLYRTSPGSATAKREPVTV